MDEKEELIEAINKNIDIQSKLNESLQAQKRQSEKLEFLTQEVRKLVPGNGKFFSRKSLDRSTGYSILTIYGRYMKEHGRRTSSWSCFLLIKFGS